MTVRLWFLRVTVVTCSGGGLPGRTDVRSPTPFFAASPSILWHSFILLSSSPSAALMCTSAGGLARPSAATERPSCELGHSSARTDATVGLTGAVEGAAEEVVEGDDLLVLRGGGAQPAA